MSYQLKNSLRLIARDILFATNFWKSNLLTSLNRNGDRNIVLCNSFPKSGTHLLYQILYSIPQLSQWDDIVSVQSLSGTMNTPSHIRWKLGSAPKDSIVRSHLMYCKEINNIVEELNCKVIFIYRDLRDVAVSHARWVTKEKRIFLHNSYKQLSSFEEQLLYSINGIPLGTPLGSNISQPDIGTDFSRWKGWINDSNALSIKFEDLVGERGGGDEAKRLSSIERIHDFLNLRHSTHELKDQFSSSAMNPNDSHTFVKGGKGSIGAWKLKFQSIHKEAFKKVAGNELIELGYEQDLNW